MSQQSSQASGEGLSLPGNLGNLSLRQEAPRSDSAGSTGVPGTDNCPSTLKILLVYTDLCAMAAGWTNGDYKPPNEPLAGEKFVFDVFFIMGL